MDIFSKRLRLLREQKGLSQEELAKMLLLKSSATISQYESLKLNRIPDSHILKKLAEIFDCSTDYLLGISNNRNEQTASIALHRPGYVGEEVPPEVREEIERYARYLIDQHKKGEYNGKG